MVQFFWRAGLGNGKTVDKFDEVDHLACHQMCHAFAHVALRKDHMVSTQALHDSAMCFGVGLYPNIPCAHLVKVESCKNASFHVVANRDHHMCKIHHTELFQYFRVAGVGLSNVRQLIGQALDPFCIGIYCKNLVSKLY